MIKQLCPGISGSRYEYQNIGSAKATRHLSNLVIIVITAIAEEKWVFLSPLN
jgi:hypothetical protein